MHPRVALLLEPSPSTLAANCWRGRAGPKPFRGKTPVGLTAQEQQIASLARDGLSNQEIGDRLFLSSRTVEWHVRKVFAKLGISSMHALRSALPGRDQVITTSAPG